MRTPKPKTTSCMWKNSCSNPDRRYLCCHFCTIQKCAIRCKDLDSAKTCKYLKENTRPLSSQTKEPEESPQLQPGRKRTSKAQREIKKLQQANQILNDIKKDKI